MEVPAMAFASFGRIMSDFSPEESRKIYHACVHILIDDCTPPYLKDFIAVQLEDVDPNLSIKVRNLSLYEMDELCAAIKQQQRSPKNNAD